MMHPEQESVDLELAKSHEAAEYLGMKNWSAGDANQKRGINLNPIKRLIQRNGLLIGIPTLLAAGATTALVLLSPQTYSGNFQVLVEPMSTDGKVTQPAVLSPGSGSTTAELDYLTLVRVLTSPSVLSGIIQKIKVQYPDVNYANLTKRLTVERIEKNPGEKTKILNVAYESSEPQEILYTLNELAAGYLKFGLEDRKAQIGGGVAFIEQQLPGLKRRVETLEGQLQTLQQQYNISDLESEGEALAQQSRQVQTQQLEAQRDLAAQRRLAANLQQQLGGITPKDVLKASSLSENPRYQALLGQLKQLESQIALQSAQFQPDFPGLQTLQEQRKSLMVLLQQESQKLVGSTTVPQFQASIQKNLSQQLVDSLNQVQVLDVRNQALGQASAAIEQKTQQFPEIKRRSNDLQAQLEIAQNTLKQLQLKRESLRVEAAQKEVPWRLLSKPDLLKDPQGQLISSSRKGLQRVLLGTLGGFLLGLGLAILRERRRDIFFSLDDLQEDSRLPVLGVFPVETKTLPAASGVPLHGEHRLEESPLAKAAEALYTNLRFLPLEPGVKSLVVASASPRDGKTTIVTYLAKAAASMGQRVLVVDANMTMPQIHSWLDVPNFEGLNEVLTKNTDPNQLIQRSPQQTNLFVLPSGQVSASSRKLVASQQMQHLMSQLHTMFDLVLYDTLPLQNHADANFLSRNTDGMLLVVSVGQTRRSLVLKLMKKLQAVRIPMLGVVANQVKALPSARDADSPDSLDHFEDEFEMFRIAPSRE
ncbi:GumC family protein [Altericista sp. CCNU0014]|uniref:GumC family protein n=1 Tax=Altericista sp. CCNU0014 TaxID=3082949 RepID=UPI00384A5005